MIRSDPRPGQACAGSGRGSARRPSGDPARRSRFSNTKIRRLRGPVLPTSTRVGAAGWNQDSARSSEMR